MTFSIQHRFRRLRRSPAIRDLVRQTQVSCNDLILPLFVEENIQQKLELKTMPGVFRYPEAELPEVINRVWAKGIKAVILFGVSHKKDAVGSDSWDDDGLMARIIRAAKAAQPGMLVISDNCFCEFTDHGHCGVVVDGDVDNDLTLVNLQKQALVAARAGVDMIAPSGMMDGMIGALREALDVSGFTHIPIMSYSTKFASAFYGPFRDAVDVHLKGTRDSYQLDKANGREALAESIQDEIEGADILMVKPATVYLDVVSTIRANTTLPIAVYHVSGEYAMIKIAAQQGAIDERAVVLETMTAFKRAGADLVLTYFAESIADWLAVKEPIK